MKKIISLFQRNYDGDRLVRNEIVPGAEWVIAGEGVATQKYDGTSCRVLDGKLWKRYDVKKGKEPPAGFEPAQEPDEITGHHPGWLLVGDGPEDQWHREGFEYQRRRWDQVPVPNGTYELCGPKIQGNPEKLDKHYLLPHGYNTLGVVPTNFNALKEYLKDKDIEGIVWHHPDGRRVKIKLRDFGLKRGVLATDKNG